MTKVHVKFRTGLMDAGKWSAAQVEVYEGQTLVEALQAQLDEVWGRPVPDVQVMGEHAGERSKFDEIVDYIRKDECKQAFSYMLDLDSYELGKLLDYMSTDLNDTQLALNTAKMYIRKSAR